MLNAKLWTDKVRHIKLCLKREQSRGSSGEILFQHVPATWQFEGLAEKAVGDKSSFTEETVD